LTFFFSTFFGGAFLGKGRGEFKNTTKIFWQKVRVENFPQNFDKNFDVSFSSTFFVLSHFRVFFSDGGSKTLQKTFCKKNRVEKFLKKNRPKVQNRLFLGFVLSRFWAFLGKGSKKNTIKNIEKNKSDPSPFLASDPPTHHGGHRFVFYWRPLALAQTTPSPSTPAGPPPAPATPVHPAHSATEKWARNTERGGGGALSLLSVVSAPPWRRRRSCAQRAGRSGARFPRWSLAGHCHVLSAYEMAMALSRPGPA
jgi:hypothetical protein